MGEVLLSNAAKEAKAEARAQADIAEQAEVVKQARLPMCFTAVKEGSQAF